MGKTRGPPWSCRPAEARLTSEPRQTLPVECVRRIQSAFLDALYAFLDGLVHVAFSSPALAASAEALAPPRGADDVSSVEGSAKGIDPQNVVSTSPMHRRTLADPTTIAGYAHPSDR